MTLSAILPGFFLSVIIGGASGAGMVGLMMIAVIIIPAVMSWMLWPKRHRSGWKMAGVGLVITATSIAVGGALAGLILSLTDTSPDSLIGVLSNMARFSVIGLLFGTLFTLGIPWILGIGVSLLFRDNPA